MDKFCSFYKSNLSGGLTSLKDLRSGASGARPLNCGVLAGASEASVVCSHVAKLSLGKVLGVVLWTSLRSVDGSSLGLLLWIQIFSPVGRMWLRFRLRVLRFAMVTIYERGVCVLHLTIPGSHL